KSTSYKSWFEPLDVLDGKKHIIYLGTKVPFILDWINDHYNSILIQYLKKASDEQITDYRMVLIQNDGSYHIEEEIIEEKPVSAKEHIKETKKLEEIDDLYTTSLNPNYTFDSFVVGEYNRLAHAASLAVAECPGKVYNPLFIQGGVGLGKTHLMQAIGHFIKENNRDAKVAYFTTENFVNEWIQAIKNNTTDQFRAKYRKVDVILMDDIQFLADKVSSQEEFFHTYNALYSSGAQIILSSDRPAYEISQLEERLASRFIWGLSTEFMSPDLETRIAILQKKAALNNIVIPSKDNEVFYYIAHQYDSNIRVLESALNRVNAFSKMTGEPITYSLAMKALENFFPEHRTKAITVELILQTTAKYFKIKPEDMRSQKRTALITYPRQIAMYLCRELTDATFEQIGKEFGNRHYSTVMHAATEIAERVKTNKATQKEIKEITESVRKM
ncbi:MAG: chromosomal replication initiator protein DnaA, partial [Firmicutes bacterium]|nr:chromosomal replication initiator protein DnaA [Bacillota bacterium]